jgi:EmrB/QacA subfamily drug resistance transporter
MKKKPLILMSLLLAAFVINLDATIVNVALPALTRELGATTSQLQWIVDAYNLVFAALLLSTGNLSDRIGRKKMLVAGLAVFGIASLAGSYAVNTSELIAARAVMGLGAAMAFPATLSLITNIFRERRERARAIGLWGATTGAAIALGPIVGGWLLENYSWSSIFVAMSPVALLGIIMVAFFISEPENENLSHIDIAGLTLSALAMGSLVYTIIEAPSYGWLDVRSIIGFAISLTLFGLFVARERRAESPMLDVKLFKNGRFSAASSAVAIAFFTLFGFTFLMTQYFQFTRGYSAISTGLHLLPVAISVAVGSIMGTALAVRLSTKLIVATGALLIAIFYAWTAIVISPTLDYSIIALQMVIYGLGLGLTSAPATESIMGAIHVHKAGVGSAINDTTRLVGGTLGVAVIGSLFASLYQDKISQLSASHIPADTIDAMKQSVGAGYTVADTVSGHGMRIVGSLLSDATTNALIHGIQVSCTVAAGVAAVGVIVSLLFLPSKPAIKE